MGGTEEFFTGAACKAVGGQWKGGHDISGHVFLLVLGSAFLWFEILPVVGRWAGLREMRMVRRGDGGVGSAEGEMVGGVVGGVVGEEEREKEGRAGLSVPVGVVGLSWWMLLMTAAYFHTWFEKVGYDGFTPSVMQIADSFQFTGLIVAFTGLGMVYFLPRAIPSMRNAIGMPGV